MTSYFSIKNNLIRQDNPFQLDCFVKNFEPKRNLCLSKMQKQTFPPIWRGGSGDGNKEDGQEVGGHQFAHDFPLQKDFYDDPRV